MVVFLEKFSEWGHSAFNYYVHTQGGGMGWRVHQNKNFCEQGEMGLMSMRTLHLVFFNSARGPQTTYNNY